MTRPLGAEERADDHEEDADPGQQHDRLDGVPEHVDLPRFNAGANDPCASWDVPTRCTPPVRSWVILDRAGQVQPPRVAGHAVMLPSRRSW